MAYNTFNDNLLNPIARNLEDGFVVKKSAVYTKAVVIGRPGVKGSLILSLFEETADRPYWSLHLELDKDPKTLSDGASITGEEFRYYCFGDMLKGVRDLTKELSN